jgi:hypothetical protein
MIDAAERQLADSMRRPPRAPLAAAKALAEPDRLAWALDPIYSQALLVPALRAAHGDGLEILGCRPDSVASKEARPRLRWRLSGLLDGERWRGVAEGFSLSSKARAGVVRRLEAVRAELADDAEALLLPRPLAHLPPLRMAAIEPPGPASPVPALPSSDGGIETAIGRAIGKVQLAKVEFGKVYGAEHDVDAVARRVKTLSSSGHSDASTLESLLAAVQGLLATTTVPLAPILRGLHLRKLCLVDGRISALSVRDVVTGPRPLTMAALLAELTTSTAVGDSGERALAAMRAGWLTTTGGRPAELRPFEALALIRHAADEAIVTRDRTAVFDQLIAAASRCLES